MSGKPIYSKNQIAAMLAMGASHNDIATALDCSTKTVQRVSAEVRDDISAADSKLMVMQTKIAAIMDAEKRIEEYVELLNVAKATKQPAAGSAILSRLDDLDGIVTDKERLRAKVATETSTQPMFVFAGPASVQVQVGPGVATPPQPVVIDVTPVEPAEAKPLPALAEGQST